MKVMNEEDLAPAGRWVVVDLPERADRLAFNARGTLLAAAATDTDYAVVVDLATGREVGRVNELWHGDYHAFEFLKEGLLGIANGKVVRWDLDNGTLQVLWKEEGLGPQ